MKNLHIISFCHSSHQIDSVPFYDSNPQIIKIFCTHEEPPYYQFLPQQPSYNYNNIPNIITITTHRLHFFLLNNDSCYYRTNKSMLLKLSLRDIMQKMSCNRNISHYPHVLLHSTTPKIHHQRSLTRLPPRKQQRKV